MAEHSSTPTVGVTFPTSGENRSTSAAGRMITAAALRKADPTGARAVEHETDWRRGYLEHFRRLVEAGAVSPEDATTIAREGVAAVAATLQWHDLDGTEHPLSEIGSVTPRRLPETQQRVGSSDPVTELAIPFDGEVHSGAKLEKLLHHWMVAGSIEPGVREAVLRVAENPEWLSLPGRILIALGAGAEIGPTPTLLSWGATVAAVDLPRPELWQRIIAGAEKSAGTLMFPARPGPEDLEQRCGLDLLTELPETLAWLRSLAELELGDLVLGNYIYADGGTNVRVSAAGDALGVALREAHPQLATAWLATPTDVFVVPDAAVHASTEAYEQRRPLSRRGLRAISGGRLLQRNYAPGVLPGINDSLVPQQGPNYALAKRMQRWRATADRADGHLVSMNVAPPTRTASVIKNRALKAAYAGAHRFGVEVFEPATTQALMAALLVHDLYVDQPTFEHPLQAEGFQAAHGGLWRTPYSARSALGLAALLGYGASR